MAKAHFIVPTSPSRPPMTVRLGTSGAAGQYSDLEVGKFTKLSGESAHVLAAAGDDIDGVITSVEDGTSAGFSVGGVARCVPGDTMRVTFDGLQASPGSGGNLAIGDIVVVGTVVAKGTAMTRYPRVCKATTPANVVQKYRVVSLGTIATGAVGTEGVIERI